MDHEKSVEHERLKQEYGEALAAADRAKKAYYEFVREHYDPHAGEDPDL